MKRWIGLLSLAIATTGMFGCSMCCGPYDYDYPTFGGKHQRVNPNWGRVGSIFSDPTAAVGGPSADSNLEPPPSPRRNNLDDDDGDSQLRLEDIDDIDERLRQMDDGIEGLEPIAPMPDTESVPSPDNTEEKTTMLRNRLRRGSWR